MGLVAMRGFRASVSALAYTVCALVRRFHGDSSGNFVIIAALGLPVLVGFAGLGSDAALWLYKRRAMQSAADSAAFSTAIAYINNVKSMTKLQAEARSAAGSYGFISGSNRVDVILKWPYDSRPGSMEVTVAQQQAPLFARLFVSDVTIRARAVAVGTPKLTGTGCVLSLNSSASGAITIQGSTNVVLDQCSLGSNSSSSSALTIGGSAQLTALSVGVVGGVSGSTSRIDASGGITTGAAATLDPYAKASYPPLPNRCDKTNYVSKVTEMMTPARWAGDPADPVPPLYVLCGGMTLNAGANVTLGPGIYYLVESDGGQPGALSMQGGATLSGTGVTLVFTSRNGTIYAGSKINGGAAVNLTAPSSGPTAGIVVFGDRQMAPGTSFQFSGGSTQILNGAVYASRAAMTFSGGSGTSNACTQLVADTVTFTGSSHFKIGCNNGMQEISATPASVSLIQ